LWSGSLSADPFHWITNPDPALFSNCFQYANKIKFFSFPSLLLITYQYRSVDGRILIRTNNYDSGDGSPKNYGSFGSGPEQWLRDTFMFLVR
jgi:hypothetical protein